MLRRTEVREADVFREIILIASQFEMAEKSQVRVFEMITKEVIADENFPICA